MNSIDTSFLNFTAAISEAWTYYHRIFSWLFISIAIVQIIFILIGYATTGKPPVEPIVLILKISFWWIVAFNFPQITQVIKWTAIRIGAIGANSQIITNPTDIFMRGWETASRVLRIVTKLPDGLMEDNGFLNKVMNFGEIYAVIYLNMPKIIIGLIVFVAIIACYLLIMVQVYLAFTEFAIVSTIGSILIPFGILKQTSYLSEKLFGSIISHAIKLLLLQFILGVGAELIIDPVMSTAADITEVKIINLIGLVANVLIYAVLVLNIPSLATGILSGQPSLTIQSLAKPAVLGAAAGRSLKNAGSASKKMLGAGVRVGTSIGGGLMKAAGAAQGARTMSAVTGGSSSAQIAAGAGAFIKSAGRSLSQTGKRKGQEIWRDIQNPASSFKSHGGQTGNPTAQKSSGLNDYLRENRSKGFLAGALNNQNNLPTQINTMPRIPPPKAPIQNRNSEWNGEEK